MLHVPSKQPDLKTSIFAVMSQMSAEFKAINLSQGFPDFDVHPGLIDRVYKYMKEGHNQYAPMPGIPALREAIAEKTESLYRTAYDPANEITITAGATEALFAAITAVVHPRDEVIVFEPWYDAYVPVIQYSRGVPRFIKMIYPDYHIDWEEVRKSITPATRAIILNSPHNPTGSVLSPEDIRALTEIVRDTNIIIISDEVYEHILFDGNTHQSMASNHELYERSMVISSFGKTYHTTGWKIGYCLAPTRLCTEFRKVHQFLTYAVNTPVQYAYADFLKDRLAYLELSAFYQHKRDYFRNLLSGSRFRLLPCAGTYFQLADYSAISDEPDTDFTRRLVTEHGIAAIPTSVFYHRGDNHKVIRFCFAKKEETLNRAAERLCRI